MKRELLLGSLLLAGGLATAHTQTPTLPADEIVGKAVFEVQKSVGGHAYMLPKVRVAFEVYRLAEHGADIPDGNAICSIIKRTAEHSDKLDANITITVLKCGEYEYGIAGVLFDDGKR